MRTLFNVQNYLKSLSCRSNYPGWEITHDLDMFEMFEEVGMCLPWNIKQLPGLLDEIGRKIKHKKHENSVQSEGNSGQDEKATVVSTPFGFDDDYTCAFASLALNLDTTDGHALLKRTPVLTGGTLVGRIISDGDADITGIEKLLRVSVYGEGDLLFGSFIAERENAALVFKSQPSTRVLGQLVLKYAVAFLNARRLGTLVAGIEDGGRVCGIESDRYARDQIHAAIDKVFMKRIQPIPLERNSYIVRWRKVVGAPTGSPDLAVLLVTVLPPQRSRSVSVSPRIDMPGMCGVGSFVLFHDDQFNYWTKGEASCRRMSFSKMLAKYMEEERLKLVQSGGSDPGTSSSKGQCLPTLPPVMLPPKNDQHPSPGLSPPPCFSEEVLVRYYMKKSRKVVSTK
eukprot:263899_1